jgi:hypothetical protein
MHSKTVQDTFNELEQKLKNGIKYEDLQNDLDSLLGPLDDVVEDKSADSDWENDYRNQGTD